MNTNAPGKGQQGNDKDLSNAKGEDRLLRQDTTPGGDNGILLEGNTDKKAEKKLNVIVSQRSHWNTPENKTRRANCTEFSSKRTSNYCFYCSYRSGKNKYVYYPEVTSCKRKICYCKTCDVNLYVKTHTWKKSYLVT